MKFTPNKYLLFFFLLAGSMSFSAPGNPPSPPPAGAPPPGFSIDSGIWGLVFVGIIFSLTYLKNYSKSRY